MTTARDRLDAGLRFQKSGLLDDALACYREVTERERDPALVSEALRRTSDVHYLRSEWDVALDTAERAALVAKDAGLTVHFAEALNQTAAVYIGRGEFDSAVALLEQALATSTDPRLRGLALQNLAVVAAQQGDFDRARAHFLDAQRAFQRAGSLWGEAFVLINFGCAAMDFGNFRVAVPMLENALGVARRVGDLGLIASATLNYAEAQLGAGDYARADELARQANEYFTSAGNKWLQLSSLRVLGDVAARRGDAPAARARYEDALTLATEIGATRDVDALRARLETGGPPLEERVPRRSS